jgi:hypothetical protein
MLKGKKKLKSDVNNKDIYFSHNDQLNIEKYLKEENEDLKKEIYEKEIFPVFTELVDNLIKVYKFKSSFSTAQELQIDCVVFLFESLHKWNPDRGTKAFSYFNVVAKNWLIANTRKHNKKSSIHISIDDYENLSTKQKNQIEENSIVLSPDTVYDNKQIRSEIIKLLKDIKCKLKKENELRCLFAIETLFNSIDDLELLNKRAIHIYLSEISGLDRKTVSKVLVNLKKHYYSMTKNKLKYDIF